MTSHILQLLRRRQHFRIGLAALGLLGLALVTGLRTQSPMPRAMSFWWSLVTGVVLSGCIAHQWRLLLARLWDDRHDAARRMRRHRQVGAVAICLFVLHAGNVGYALLTVLACVFLVVSTTGLFNSEVMPLTRPWQKRCWSYIHISLSGLLLPLIAFHAWAALAFK